MVLVLSKIVVGGDHCVKLYLLDFGPARAPPTQHRDTWRSYPRPHAAPSRPSTTSLATSRVLHSFLPLLVALHRQARQACIYLLKRHPRPWRPFTHPHQPARRPPRSPACHGASRLWHPPLGSARVPPPRASFLLRRCDAPASTPRRPPATRRSPLAWLLSASRQERPQRPSLYLSATIANQPSTS